MYVVKLLFHPHLRVPRPAGHFYTGNTCFTSVSPIAGKKVLVFNRDTLSLDTGLRSDSLDCSTLRFCLFFSLEFQHSLRYWNMCSFLKIEKYARLVDHGSRQNDLKVHDSMIWIMKKSWSGSKISSIFFDLDHIWAFLFLIWYKKTCFIFWSGSKSWLFWFWSAD